MTVDEMVYNLQTNFLHIFFDFGTTLLDTQGLKAPDDKRATKILNKIPMVFQLFFFSSYCTLYNTKLPLKKHINLESRKVRI